MDGRRLFVLIVAASLLLASMLIFAQLAGAQPALAAGGTSPLIAAGFSPELEANPRTPIELAGGPGPVRPPNVPYPAPLLQETSSLTVTKSAEPSPVDAEGVLTYTIVVTNGDIADVTGAMITDTLDNNVSFALASEGGTHDSGVVTWDVGVIPMGQTITRTLWVTVSHVPDGTILNNTVTVTSTGGISDTDTITTPVTTAADLTVTKSDSPDPVLVGTPLEYNLTVTNAGPNLATNVVLVDRLPSGVIFQSSTPGAPTCSHASGVVTCNLGELPDQDSTSVTIIVEPTVWGTIVNRAEVKADEPDPDPADNNTSEATKVNPRTADLEISKSDSADPVVAGTSFTYGLTITNHGPFDAFGVTVSDSLPAELTFDASGSSPECSTTGQEVTCLIGDLPVDETVNLTIGVSVDSSLPADTVLTNTAAVSGDEVDPNQVNDIATEDTLILRRFRAYLPMIVRPVFTELSVFNENTGGNVTFTVLGTGVSCSVPNNATRFCGSFPAGTYDVKVTSACGDGVFPKTYAGGPVTTRVYCN